MKTTIKILLAVCSVILLSGCIFEDIGDNAAKKRGLDQSTIIYNGQFGIIRKEYIESENLTCYFRINGYEGGLSCFDGKR